jgi:hypothetical protein
MLTQAAIWPVKQADSIPTNIFRGFAPLSPGSGAVHKL